ncbi:Smr/MutS family protein [Candidatus Pelagibacter sp.]|nr:Smr/MutS family protein [Candidatus Pelagibacter sp.]MDB9923801.1 Smr/MutS family protein [Candidatus Pelagibacter sp.]
MTDEISQKDKKDWENFLSKKEKLPNKDINSSKEKKIKIKNIDLHGYKLDEANKKIESFIKQSYIEKVNKLIVVTGKGLHSQNEKDPYVSKDLSILRYSVPHFIKNNNELMKMINDFDSATIEDGGSGAFYIYIKKKV